MTFLLVVVVITLMLTPTIFCPLLLMDGYILPQIGIMAFGMSVALIGFLMQGMFPVNLTILLAGLFFVYSMVSGAWSSVPHNSLRDIPLIFGSVVGFMIASVLFNGNPFNMTIVSIGVVVTLMFTCAYGLLQKFKIDPLFKERLKPRIDEDGNKIIDDRAISSLGNTNFAAGYYSSTLPFVFYLIIEVSPWFLLSLGVYFLGMWSTKSRKDMLGVTIGILFFIIAISTQGKVFDVLFYLFAGIRVEYTILLCTLTLMFGGYFYLWAKEKNPLWFLSIDNRLNTMLDISGTHQDHFIATLRYRFRYWAAAKEMIFRRPLQGYGLRTYRKEVYDSQARLTAKDPEFMGYDYQTPQPRECHNDYVENFVEGGIVSGFLFILIVGVVLFNCYQYVQAGGNFLLVAGVVSGLVITLINAFFFFPMRLGASALTFWIGLALIENITGSVKLITLPVHPIVIFMVILALAAMLWEGVIKPNLGNYYFSKYNISIYNKGKWINKALDCCPKESIFLTHMLIGHLWINPNQADQYAEQLRRHFDGMVPGWTMAYNSGLAKALTKNYEDAVRFFRDSLKYYPSFEPAATEYKRYYPFAAFPRGGPIVVKAISEAAQNHISWCESEMKTAQGNLANLELTVANVLLNEKINMNIPPNWAYDMASRMFIPPDQIGGRPVSQMGPTRLLIIKPA